MTSGAGGGANTSQAPKRARSALVSAARGAAGGVRPRNIGNDGGSNDGEASVKDDGEASVSDDGEMSVSDDGEMSFSDDGDDCDACGADEEMENYEEEDEALVNSVSNDHDGDDHDDGDGDGGHPSGPSGDVCPCRQNPRLLTQHERSPARAHHFLAHTTGFACHFRAAALMNGVSEDQAADMAVFVADVQAEFGKRTAPDVQCATYARMTAARAPDMRIYACVSCGVEGAAVHHTGDEAYKLVSLQDLGLLRVDESRCDNAQTMADWRLANQTSDPESGISPPATTICC